MGWRLWWWLVALPLAAGHLNVLISQAEVMKLLGLDAELYYVREGVVNTYATGFIVPVPAHIADLEFMWQSLGRKPLPYVMDIDYESRGAMLPPQVNISERGYVPTTLQTFRVRLPCTGSRSAEILVSMQLNISAPDRASRDVRLNFKRNKICLKGLSTVVSHNETARLAGDVTRSSSGVLFAAGGCAAAALALLAAAAAAGTLYRRGNKARHHDSIHTSYTTAAYGSHQNVLLRLDTMGRPPSSTGSYATIASLHKFPFGSRRSPSPYATTHIGEHVYAKPESRVSYYAASNLTHVSQTNTLKDRITDPAEQLRHLTAPRANIRLEILVHEGTFGRVYKGVFKRGDTYEEVLVKTVSDNASAMQAALLVAEGLRLCGLSHANVLAPAAACAEEARRPLLVYVCASHSSNLKRFLTSCRLGQQAAPATRELVELGAQVACGLSYLHVQRLIHADVAARNCVVDEKLRLKLADNGLSRDLFPEEYHCLGDNENRPVKWMAPETILQCQYTSASDVWSLGVTLWELATLGAPPLAELDAADVGAFLSGGYRPAQPHNCPDELYGLMSWCWTSAAAGRPTAPQLLAALHDFRQALNTYI
ncbi:tyrosine-protein kinase Dnt isoform X2 [Plutella xylostella]|uniref:tyrosine-protein kinase Dnt isoform X2 n=1 Tax=Plutella xylostella TaxID=51655 RepID=UPI002032F4DB|nr:tyrosine-protein kinase Dnt isoform X2 [Plutella xylostella]